MPSSFYHLRMHSSYSLGQSSLKVQDVIDLALANQMNAIALTDVNNMFGAKEFSYLAASKGVKPIIGMELSVALPKELLDLSVINGTSSRTNSELLRKEALRNHAPVVLLAKSQKGYKNLLKLHKELFFNSTDLRMGPSVSFASVLKYSEDIVLLSGGNLGLLGQVMLREQDGLTENIVLTLKQAFGNNFFIELNRFPNQYGIYQEDNFLTLAQKYEVPVVATANTYFKSPKEHHATDILTCIGGGHECSSFSREFLSKEQYFTSSEQMQSLFADLPEALSNTKHIIKICNFLVEGKDPTLPSFPAEEGEVALLQKLARKGLEERLKTHFSSLQTERELSAEQEQQIRREYEDRLDYELSIIIKMNFAGYFLIVADFINWSLRNDIPVGPGRGSGAGSLVAWALGITGINPIRFGLFFERFLNPERISMPDFDIDLCQRGRGEVINYVLNKYGADKVAQIITFGSMQARGVLRDVGRVLGVPYSEIDKLCKRIPYGANGSNTPLKEILKEDPSLKEEVDRYYTLNELFNTASQLENLYKNISTHAAGVIISSEPLDEVVPLYKDSSSPGSLPAVGFSMKHAEAVGLVKFDFLGLKTLTVIKDTVNLIKRTRGLEVDLNSIPTHNESAIKELLSSGRTLGIFQVESSGMKEVLLQLCPDNIEDIIAIISLYRPGPMGNIPDYIKRKHGKAAVPSMHPMIDDILAETFGIMIYQEQVMQIAQRLANYTLGEADLLRRAMGKKQPQEMADQKSKFLSGAKQNGIEASLAEEIFEQMAKFAGYGFNKSHAAAYAFVSWQTAYLKAHYSAEFIAVAMKHELSDSEKLLAFIEEAKDFDIKVLPPEINRGSADFVPVLPIGKASEECTSEVGPVIHYSLQALKGASQTLVEHIAGLIKEGGPFKSLEDFLERVDSNHLTKRQLEVLIKSSALDSLEPNRGKLLANIQAMLDYNSLCSKNREASAQVSLFDTLGDAGAVCSLKLEPASDISNMEKLLQEAEVVGFFLSGHPLKELGPYLEEKNVSTYSEVLQEKLHKATLAVVILKAKVVKNRRGVRYINLQCSDTESSFVTSVFGKSFEKFKDTIREGEMYLMHTTSKFDGTDCRLFLDQVKLINKEKVLKKLTGSKAKTKEDAQIGTANITLLQEGSNHPAEASSLPLPPAQRTDNLPWHEDHYQSGQGPEETNHTAPSPNPEEGGLYSNSGNNNKNKDLKTLIVSTNSLYALKTFSDICAKYCYTDEENGHAIRDLAIIKIITFTGNARRTLLLPQKYILHSEFIQDIEKIADLQHSLE